jgi:hypothetical protein
VEKRFSDGGGNLRFFVMLGGDTLSRTTTTAPHFTNQPTEPHPQPPKTTFAMGKAKKTRKFAQVKRMISSRDGRLKANAEKEAAAAQKKEKDELVREMFASPPHVTICRMELIRKKFVLDPKSRPPSSSNTTKPCDLPTRCWWTPTSSTSASRKNSS